jgi:hypothetical protein
MNVKYKAHADKAGIVKPSVRARQKCNECGQPIQPLFQPTRNPKDWFWLDCHTCQLYLELPHAHSHRCSRTRRAF